MRSEMRLHRTTDTAAGDKNLAAFDLLLRPD
jgi:hypothetical protein